MSRQLNDKQITTLRIALKFRYVTTDNLAKDRAITNNSAYSALEILRKTGYVGKIHDKSYRLLNKSARYYLTQQGLNFMRNNVRLELDEAIWKNRKNDEKKTPEFIDQQVAVHAAHNELRALLGDKAKILVATEEYGIDNIIRPLPNLLVVLPSRDNFFVELTDGQHLFLAKKRIRKYIQHYEDAEWEWNQYPDVYIVRSSANDRTRLRKYIEEQMDNNYLDEDDFKFTVIKDLRTVTT